MIELTGISVRFVQVRPDAEAVGRGVIEFGLLRFVGSRSRGVVRFFYDCFQAEGKSGFPI